MKPIDAKNIHNHKYAICTQSIFSKHSPPNILSDGGTKVVLCMGSLYARVVIIIVINKNNTKWVSLKELNSAVFEVNWFGELFIHI